MANIDILSPLVPAVLDMDELQYLQETLDTLSDSCSNQQPQICRKKRRVSTASSTNSAPGELEASVQNYYSLSHSGSSVLCSVLNCTRLARKGGTCIAHLQKSQSLPESFSQDISDESEDNNDESLIAGDFSFLLEDVENDMLFTQLPTICEAESCQYIAHSKNRCRFHNGAICKSPGGCLNQAQTGGFCRRHGGGIRCRIPGCPKAAQKRSLCTEHGGKRVCQSAGCQGTDRGGGFCTEHRKHLLCHVPKCRRMHKINGLCTKHAVQNFIE